MYAWNNCVYIIIPEFISALQRHPNYMINLGPSAFGSFPSSLHALSNIYSSHVPLNIQLSTLRMSRKHFPHIQENFRSFHDIIQFTESAFDLKLVREPFNFN